MLPMDYHSSGVNIEAGNRAVDYIKEAVKKTYTPNVLASLGGFAAGFKFDTSQYKDPILVSCTDGVGTKLRLAIELEKFDTVGIDLVAMSVNDLICMGATPLFFLDYIACHELIPDQMKEIISGMVQGCQEAGCALIGGEMAEMNDMYRQGDFDLAGFCVGVVERAKVIDGTGIKSGQYVYGLPSSGVHSNGFSLVRKVLTPEICRQEGIDRMSLLEPTIIYVKQVLAYIKQGQITGLAHITGGGLQENIERVLPKTVSLTINRSDIPIHSIFNDIQRLGNVSDDEMFRVFNMGVGMVMFSENSLPETDTLVRLGTVSEGNGTVNIV
jgi:phosphoribosylformylglycinamidine cyclo-ligase